MVFETITFEREDPLVFITLNRPEKLNAINYQLLNELREAIDEINEMSDVRAVIIKGAGRAFCSGTDLQALGDKRLDRGRPGYRYHLTRLQETFNRLELLAKPVIAQIHGYSIGGGLELTLSCDFRLCTIDTSFQLPEVRYCIIPDLGGCQRLVRLVGLSKAKELVMLGKMIDGKEAERIGLVNKAVADVKELEQQCRALTNNFLDTPPLAIGLAKHAVTKSLDSDIISSLSHTAQIQSMLVKSDDFQEGIDAKLKKRCPKFEGR